MGKRHNVLFDLPNGQYQQFWCNQSSSRIDELRGRSSSRQKAAGEQNRAIPEIAVLFSAHKDGYAYGCARGIFAAGLSYILPATAGQLLLRTMDKSFCTNQAAAD